MSDARASADERIIAAVPAEPHEHGPDHVVPIGVYVAVFLALMVGTALTVWVARLELGAWNTPVALAIAFTKALLVMLFFMHVKYSPRLVWLTLAASFFWLFHMIVGTIADYITRGMLGSPGT